MPIEENKESSGSAETLDAKTNNRVVSLIKGKLLPLNRAKYEHLQKINRAKKR